MCCIRRAFLYLLSTLICLGCSKVTSYIVDDPQSYVDQSVAILSANSQSEIAPQLWEELQNKMVAFFEKSPSFAKTQSLPTLKSSLQNQPQLRLQLNRYINTLSLVGISDKNLVRQFQPLLEVNQIFLMQMEEFPCTLECSSAMQVVLHLQLWDLIENKVIWRGWNQLKLDEDQLSPAEYRETMLTATDELLERFTEEYQVYWQIKRYQQLRKRFGRS